MHGAATPDVSSPEPVTAIDQSTPRNTTLPIPWQNHTSLAPHTRHARLTSESTLTTVTESTSPWYSGSSSTSLSRSSTTTMSVFSTKAAPPHTINVSSPALSDSTPVQKVPPKSPGGSKLGSFFGWGGISSPASSTTTFSETPYSPLPTPSPQAIDHFPTSANASKTTTRNPPKSIDIPKANASAESYFGNAHIPLPLATPSSPVQIEEMENELKEISAELAASIRREMDLEDLVERLQAEAQNQSGAGKRTSDYFSDSGASSTKYGETDSRQDELDRLIRKTEQEKAQMKLELTDKVQDERTRRKNLEAQIRILESKASNVRLLRNSHQMYTNLARLIWL